MLGKIFKYPLIIKETHLDTFGHVNNATYFALLEEARWDLMVKNGYGLKKIQETGIGPTILEITIRFIKELHARDEIIIETQIISYDKKIARMVQKIFRHDELCSEAVFVIALFSLKERKLIMPTPEWLQAVGFSEE